VQSIPAHGRHHPGSKRPVKSLPREIRHVITLVQDAQALFQQSQLSTSILGAVPRAATKILSLGLGSFFSLRPPTQTRRIKQLGILLSIQQHLAKPFSEHEATKSIPVFAQDPGFTKQDEVFLSALGLKILRTPSGSDLGEARSIIDDSTLVYSPFLTLEAYELLLATSRRKSSQALPVRYLLGDDVNALLKKWPKHSAEREQVERVARTGLAGFRRRGVGGEGFWRDEDESFPMALYAVEDRARL